jgi:hypothetical protein
VRYRADVNCYEFELNHKNHIGLCRIESKVVYIYTVYIHPPKFRLKMILKVETCS